MSTIAFLGTGTMGMPMARNLVDAGFSVRVWNRTPERAEPLRDHGADLCSSPAEAARGATVLITMLRDAGTVLDAAADAVGSLEPNAIWIQMSTIGVEGIALCEELAERAKLELVDAPVLGTKEPAEKGTLVVLASGPREALTACEQIFDAVASKTVTVGDAGDGTRCKLVANNWLLGLTAVLGESITLARSLEINPGDFLKAIADGPLDSPYAHIKGRAMIEGDFSEASFKLDLALKDAGLVLTEVENTDLKMPVLRAAAEHLERASAAGHGEQDMAAMQLSTQPLGSAAAQT